MKELFQATGMAAWFHCRHRGSLGSSLRSQAEEGQKFTDRGILGGGGEAEEGKNAKLGAGIPQICDLGVFLDETLDCPDPWLRVCSRAALELRKSRNPAECEMIPLRRLGDIPAWNNNGDAEKHREEGREKASESLKLESDTKHVNMDVLRHSQGNSDCGSQKFHELMDERRRQQNLQKPPRGGGEEPPQKFPLGWD